jgi:hypothetical protein
MPITPCTACIAASCCCCIKLLLKVAAAVVQQFLAQRVVQIQLSESVVFSPSNEEGEAHACHAMHAK